MKQLNHLHFMLHVASRNNIVIDFISKLTMAMNTRYNATLFILQQEYIQTHMFTKVLVSILQQQLCLPIT